MSKNKRNNPFTKSSALLLEPPKFPTLTPWIWDLEGVIPGMKKLDFTVLSDRPNLFRPILSAAWVLYIDCIPRKSTAYIQRSRTVILKFASYLTHHVDKDIQKLSTLHDLTREILLEYRAWVDEKYSSSSANFLYMSVIRMLTLLQSEQSPFPGCISGKLEIPTRSLKSKGYDTKRTQPYSRDEENAIIKACKLEINEILDRLGKGAQLLSIGMDPRLDGKVRQPWNPKAVFTDGWYKKENILWYAANILKGKLPSQSDRSELYTRFYSNPRPRLPFKGTVGAFELLYSQSTDLIPFIVLLSLKTGLNADSILTLTRNCIVGVEGDKTIVEYKKGRGSHESMTRGFSNKGSMSPVGIIKTVLQMTERLALIADEEIKDQLWLSFQVCRYSNNVSTSSAPSLTFGADGSSGSG